MIIQQRCPLRLAYLVILVLVASIGPALSTAAAGTLVTADFNSGTNGFVYADDAFGTSQPGYASGVRVASGGYGGTGGLQVTLGGVDATAITGLSGGWSYTLNLAAAETGVKLAFRYKLDQTATYEYDEYTRLLVKADGVQYGRGAKNYVDHIGGDGASTQGNSSSYLPTTDWQQAEIYLGDLAAGSHTIVLGGYNNKKDAVDEATTATIDDVVVTSGNAAPVVSAAQSLADRVSISQFLAYNQGIAQFHDRCRGSGMSCSSTDYTTNYMNALAWVEGQLRGLGYTTFRHAFNYNGNTGTNICGTKQGTVTPTQMYIVSGHLDARSGGDGFDDDGSAVALGLEAARVLAGTDVTTDKSVRFCFWDKEEVGLYGARGYVQDRYSLQGTTAEPTWLGVIQHDMILYDHGAGTRTTAQSAYADLDVEWRAGTTKEADSRALALKWAYAVGQYAPDYPATAYNYSTNTDDTAFHSSVASISVRENRRSLSGEWINPYYHTTSDIESSYTRDDDADGKRDDIELGYNAVRTTLGLVAELAGAHVATANTAPVANAQTVTTAEDTAVAITLTGSDSDGDPLTYSVASGPSYGSLSGTAPALSYTPAANYNGADSFTFVVNDGTVDSAPAMVSITVSPINDPPVANPQAVMMAEDTAVAITLTGSDPDGDPLTYSVASGPSYGTLSGTAPALSYVPTTSYHGPDSLTFVVNDGTVDSAPAMVNITVTPVNDPPVANPQAVTMAEDTAVAITLTASDANGDPLTYNVVTQPAHGFLTGAAPDLTYSPVTNYHGPDSFTFRANDGQADSAPATVSFTVTSVNDPPVANPQSVGTTCNTPVAITLTGSDVDGDPLTFSVSANPAHGTLSGAAPMLTYIPDPDYSGGDSLAFVADDGAAASSPANVTITVGSCSALPLPFIDDFESDRGWTVNPAGTNWASRGQWEGADPQPTDDRGPRQLDAASGSRDLVTGALAGSNPGKNDVDGGVTSIRSPDIQLPTGQDITLALKYYFAHARNASLADYFRVQVVGVSDSAVVLEVRGANIDVDAVWRTFNASLNSFAGQAVYLLIEAADLSRDSLVEAAVDDVAITAAAPTPPLLSATFDSDAEGFAYGDDGFRSTAQPDYAIGAWVGSGGHNGGALQVTLGGIDTVIVEGMSGGWSRSFTSAGGPVQISFWYRLTQSPDYESDECSQTLVMLDGILYGSGTADYVAQVCGNGNGGSAETTGWRLFSIDTGSLTAGSHTLTLGSYNNRKSSSIEDTEALFDDVIIRPALEH